MVLRSRGIQNNLLTKTKLVSYSENDSSNCESIDKEDSFLQLLDWWHRYFD